MAKTKLFNYLELRKISPQAARKIVLDYLKSNKGNIAQTAKAFGVTRVTVYDIIKKGTEGDLKDRPKAPKKYLKK